MIAGVLPVHIAFMAAAAAFVITDVIKPAELYTAIDWPVIVLLAALFPVGGALESTGGAALIADGILRADGGPQSSSGCCWSCSSAPCSSPTSSTTTPPRVLMAPIAHHGGERLNVNADPFLMAVAIGASCAFLTPIGHQSNTLVMEPGGYKFGDYWRVGLPLEVVIVAVAMPMLLLVWPP